MNDFSSIKNALKIITDAISKLSGRIRHLEAMPFHATYVPAIYVGAAPVTAALLDAQYLVARGRAPIDGDLCYTSTFGFYQLWLKVGAPWRYFSSDGQLS
jgi:hypothetical protein